MRVVFKVLTAVFLLASCQSRKEGKNESLAPEQTVVPQEKLSEADRQLNEVLDAYLSLKDALVEADTAMANKAADQIRQATDTGTLKSAIRDSVLLAHLSLSLGDINAEAVGLISETDLTQKRRGFAMMSEQLLPILREYRYKGRVLYWQECPMAFNDEEKANWISISSEVVNPYLGKKHPKYGAGMLHCGEVRDTLTFRP
jgi:hypothetical protein